MTNHFVELFKVCIHVKSKKLEKESLEKKQFEEDLYWIHLWKDLGKY